MRTGDDERRNENSVSEIGTGHGSLPSMAVSRTRMRRSAQIGNRDSSEIRFRRRWDGLGGKLVEAGIVLGTNIFLHWTRFDAPVALHCAPGRGEGAGIVHRGNGFNGFAPVN